MSPQRPEWSGKDTAECVGMLLLSAVALTACTGNLSIDDLRVYAQTAGDLAMPAAAGLGGALLAVAVLLVAVRYLRVATLTAARSFWLYRRRWAEVLGDLGLTETAGEHVRVPRIVSVIRHGDEDVVTVRMVPGQSAEHWAARAAALACEFGASSAQVHHAARPHREVVVVFNRGRSLPPPSRPMLALPAPQPHPLPLALPTQQRPQPQQQPQGRPDQQVALRVVGLRLSLVWARVQRVDQNGFRVARPRYGLRGGMEWAWATSL